MFWEAYSALRKKKLMEDSVSTVYKLWPLQLTKSLLNIYYRLFTVYVWESLKCLIN